MGIRILFFLGLICSIAFIDNSKLYSACAEGEAGDAEKKNALESGNFISCGKAGGSDGSAFVAEFGKPQEPVDEDKPEGDLKPIEPTLWDNKPTINVEGSSDIKFHFFTLKNNATINVTGTSRMDLQLHNNTSDLTFNVEDGVVMYSGSNKGKVNVFLPNKAATNDFQGSTFYAGGNVNYLDFEADGSQSIFGGSLIVGGKDSKGLSTPASITVDYIKGNGYLELQTDSKLRIKNYEVNEDAYNGTGDNGKPDFRYAIQEVSGRGDVVFESKMFVKYLEVLNATFNKESKIETIRSETGKGKHIFNANSEIDVISVINNMVINNNSHILVKQTTKIEEANITKGSVLELLAEGTATNNNVINKIQGEGTLHINQDDKNDVPFTITDINLNQLILDDGKFIIQNDTPNYKNVIGEQEDEDEKPEEETVLRRIKNITKTYDETDGEKGGEIIVEGTVIFDNIDYLKKLTVCSTTTVTNCDKNSNLSVKKVNKLEELEINGGNFYIDVNHTNYTNAALNVNKASINGGKFYSVVQDTNTIKNKNTYTVLSAKDELTFKGSFEEDYKDSFKTMLPDWYSYNYQLSDDGKSLLLETQRLANYNNIISKSSYSGDYNVSAMASYFDEIVNKQTPLGISSRTFTYVDLLSNNDYDTLANNLNSLVPLSKDKYLKTAHFNLKEALDASKRNGIENKKPYGIWDRRKGTPTPENKLWFVGLSSNGKYDAELGRDEHNSTSYQFGYNIYNWVSNNNREGYTYNIVGGITKGNLDNSRYSSTISSFNIGNTLDYRDENDIVKLSLLYGLSSFDTERDYFISDYDGEDFTDLNKSRLNSSLNTHELLMDIQYSHEIFIEYLKSFSTWTNVVLIPRAYFTPSIFIGEGYSEKGEYSSLKVDYYVSTIFESGLGFDLSKSVNFSSNSNVKVFMGVDTFYRYYKFPSNTLSFEEMSSGIGIDNKAHWAGLVVSTQAGVGFDYRKGTVSAFYKREIANHYYQNIFGLGYKYSF